MDGSGVDIDELLASPEAQAVGALMLALLVGYAISTALMRASARTRMRSGDDLVSIVRRPIVLSAALVGLEWSGDLLRLDAARQAIYDASLGTLAALVWTLALVRAGDAALSAASERPDARLRGRGTSLLRYAVRLVAFGAATFALVLLWDLDLAAWSVSAGVVGVVLALAAQDSLGNLISGVFLLADAPLRIGDVIKVDALRGRVTDIGWRSTRIVTNDGIEVNLPNARLSVARIINESGGPRESIRIWCEFHAAHALTPEAVAALVVPGAEALPEVLADPPPRAYFLGKTELGLRCALLVHAADPARRNNVQDAVNSHIYARLLASGAGPARRSHDLRLAGPHAAALLAGVRLGDMPDRA